MSPTSSQSRNIQRRHNVRKYIVNASNLIIQSINSIHSPATCQPLHIPYINNQSIYTTLYQTDPTSTSSNHNNASQYYNTQPSKMQSAYISISTMHVSGCYISVTGIQQWI